MNKTEQVKEYMRLHPPQEREVGYDKRVGEKFGCAPDYVRKLRRQLGLTGIIGNGVGSPAVHKDDLDHVADAIHATLLKSRKAWTVEALSSRLDVGVAKVLKAIGRLEERNVNLRIGRETVEISKEIPQSHEPTVIDISKRQDREYTFGLTADNHLCSKYERLDVLNALFDIWERDGVKVVYQGGNMIEGERHSKTDIHTFGLQGQVDYFVEKWPRRKGIVTQFVTGDDHEGWYVQDEGINIGKFMELMAREKGREDLIYLGHMEHDIKLQASNGSAIMRLVHAGGGSSYAISYSLQKIVESYQGGEKPNILLAGHYHKLGYFFPREVHTFLAGCTKDQDSFLRKNKIAAHVGGWTITVKLGEDGSVTSVKSEMHTFFDLGYYDRAWEYKW